jgi:hypothetical protein
MVCPRDAPDVVGTCGGWDDVHITGDRVQENDGTPEEVESGRVSVGVIAFELPACEEK